ncbi:hypothetical protein K432DRAFT_49216 [Lepidopterella palustris CBS 459.81]|uniref:Uncharacterized protein n=1 Tax=Lepidopterella palustris CBS 459.81 TaxID=1314670 RepID=A0A8E2EAI4_9PEZI|nr:hypothetical protein K432DRAFT_49216 [Lepidopterella palustris CBS 459.81]
MVSRHNGLVERKRAKTATPTQQRNNNNFDANKRKIGAKSERTILCYYYPTQSICRKAGYGVCSGSCVNMQLGATCQSSAKPNQHRLVLCTPTWPSQAASPAGSSRSPEQTGKRGVTASWHRGLELTISWIPSFDRRRHQLNSGVSSNGSETREISGRLQFA